MHSVSMLSSVTDGETTPLQGNTEIPEVVATVCSMDNFSPIVEKQILTSDRNLLKSDIFQA